MALTFLSKILLAAVLYVRAANNIFDRKVNAMVGAKHARSNQS